MTYEEFHNELNLKLMTNDKDKRNDYSIVVDDLNLINLLHELNEVSGTSNLIKKSNAADNLLEFGINKTGYWIRYYSKTKSTDIIWILFTGEFDD